MSYLNSSNQAFPMGSQGSKNYLAYDMSSNTHDKYEGYIVTNFEQSSKILQQPSNIIELQENNPSVTQHYPQPQPQQQHIHQNKPQGFQVLNNPMETPKLHQTSNYYQCPVCLHLADSSCDCEYRDCSCPNGHNWYRVSGVKTMGISPNHKKN